MDVGQIGASRLTETADILSKQQLTTMLSMSHPKASMELSNFYPTTIPQVTMSYGVTKYPDASLMKDKTNLFNGIFFNSR